MTKIQILNTASDLRRAANWLYRDQKEKIPLIKRIISQANDNAEAKKVLKHFNVTEDFKNPKLQSEQLLTSSIRLKNLSNSF